MKNKKMLEITLNNIHKNLKLLRLKNYKKVQKPRNFSFMIRQSSAYFKPLKFLTTKVKVISMKYFLLNVKPNFRG